MKNVPILRAAAVVACVACLTVGCSKGGEPPALTTSDAAPRGSTAPTERGVALGLFASDPGYDYGHLLDEIQATGASDVLIAVVWAQQRVDSARVHRSHRPTTTTANDATVLRTLRQARDRSLRVTLFPIVRLEEHRADEWRGRIAPLAGVDAWFSSYSDYLLVMADLAQQGGAQRLSVGSELLSMERHERHWRALIARVRGRFDGALLYSANWDHYEPLRFWDALDAIGVTAYFELAPDPRNNKSNDDDDDLLRAWVAPRRALLDFARRQRKPLVLTEVGYPSRTTAAWHPWDETARADLDVALQARLYRAFCASWKHTDVAGFYVWNWFGFGGDNDGGYTPRGKPAAQALARCLADKAWDGPMSATTAR